MTTPSINLENSRGVPAPTGTSRISAGADSNTSEFTTAKSMFESVVYETDANQGLKLDYFRTAVDSDGKSRKPFTPLIIQNADFNVQRCKRNLLVQS